MLYADTSALAKLIVPEAESIALHRWLTQKQAHVASSDLVRTELLRAISRSYVDDAAALRTRDLLRRVTLLALTPEILTAAGALQPPTLRSLDAIHLAAAMALQDDLEAVLTYDGRMAEAAHAVGLPVLAPK